MAGPIRAQVVAERAVRLGGQHAAATLVELLKQRELPADFDDQSVAHGRHAGLLCLAGEDVVRDQDPVEYVVLPRVAHKLFCIELRLFGEEGDQPGRRLVRRLEGQRSRSASDRIFEDVVEERKPLHGPADGPPIWRRVAQEAASGSQASISSISV